MSDTHEHPPVPAAAAPPEPAAYPRGISSGYPSGNPSDHPQPDHWRLAPSPAPAATPVPEPAPAAQESSDRAREALLAVRREVGKAVVGQ